MLAGWTLTTHSPGASISSTAPPNGLAWREVESRDQVHVRDPAKGLATLIGRITHDLGKTDAGREALEAIAEGVKDAVEGRQPRW